MRVCSFLVEEVLAEPVPSSPPTWPCRSKQTFSSSLVGSLAKGFCRNSVQTSRQERVRKSLSREPVQYARNIMPPVSYEKS